MDPGSWKGAPDSGRGSIEGRERPAQGREALDVVAGIASEKQDVKGIESSNGKCGSDEMWT